MAIASRPNAALLLVSFALVLGSMPARAAFIPLDLSSIVNSDLTTYTLGSSYPGPGPIQIGGVDFVLTDGGNRNTFVAGGLGNNAQPQNYAIGGLDIANVKAMYVIVNSAFGTCGADVGSTGAQTGGGSVSFTLTEGTNVRDHFVGGFCNDVPTDLFASASFANNRIFLDVYRFDLSALTAAGTDPITGYSFVTDGAGLDGEPFLAAVTFETPAPGVLVLLIIGLAGMVGLPRAQRRRQA